MERVDKYIGTLVPHPATDYHADGFRHFGTFVGTVHSGIFTYRRGTGPDLEFLALVIQHNDNGRVSDGPLVDDKRRKGSTLCLPPETQRSQRC